MLKYRLYILLFLLSLLLPVAAQVVYECDFEDQTERDQWQLNVGNRANRCENWWYMGELGDYSPTGQWGLYVASTANPDTLTYTANNSMITIAYRTLTLTQGKYYINFDWIGQLKNTGDEGVYLYWVPATEEINSMPTTSLIPWMQTDDYRISTQNNTDPLFGAGVWKRGSGSFEIEAATETRRLMFVFFSTKGRAIDPSFAIDNIEIGYETNCPLPTNIARTLNTDASVTITWKAVATVDSYELRLCDLQTNTWYQQTVTNTPGSQKSATFRGLQEGAQSVQIRSVCGEEHSDWITYNFFYFHRGERCVDYMLLDNTTCSWSEAYTTAMVNPDGTPNLPRTLNHKGAVDNGNTDYDKTLHTLHYMPNEYDPYTLNQLKTKPDGALASVRIGRITVTHISRVEYKYKVPYGVEQILVLRYALVLPNPHPDQPEMNPVFVMETKVDGVPIADGCGAANFTSGYGEAKEWNVVPGNENPYYSGDILWKDWTEVSLNMKEYQGKTISVSFTTTGCTPSGHGGYGYLTLTCENGEMSGLNCGEENPTTDFTAPAGFTYRWWQEDRDHVLSTDRLFHIDAMDTTTYHVDLISKANPLCYHTLDVTGIPRLPFVDAAQYGYSDDNCQNNVSFIQNAYIQYKAYRWEVDVNGDSILVVDRAFTKGERLSNIVWDWGDGSPREANSDTIVTHVYPKYGGHYTAKMYATLEGTNGDCIDSAMVDINVPMIGQPDEVLHEAKGYQFRYSDGTRGSTYWSVGSDTITEMIGDCEKTYYLFIHETQFAVDTSFCEGGYYMLGDEKITTDGVHVGKLKSIYNLDSIVTLTLHVEPLLQVEMENTLVHCADNPILEIPYTVLQGKMDTIVVQFDEKAQLSGFEAEYGFPAYGDIMIPMPENSKPDNYDVVINMGTPECPVPPINMKLRNLYASSVIAQKLGIVALLNENYNGGFDFVSYQWYRNGVMLEGDTLSYLAVNDDDLGAEYSVVITDATGLTIETCPIVYGDEPTAVEDLSAENLIYPTILTAGQTIFVNLNEEYDVYNVLGMHYGTFHTAQFNAPTENGVYFIRSRQTRLTAKFIVH